MIGSPQNNFQTMQPAQQMPQPRNVMLGNAMQNMPRQPMQPRMSMQDMSQSMPQAQPSMLAPSQYGNPTPQMNNMQMPQSNASYNLQPMIPNMNQAPQGPIGINQQSQNRFGVGLASPRQMPQATQVS
jgi:hypothetical protein